MRVLPDANGQPTSYVGNFQNLGDSNLGKEVVRLDLGMPTQQTAPVGGTQSGYVSNPAQAGYWQLLGKLTQTNQEVLGRNDRHRPLHALLTRRGRRVAAQKSM